MPAPYDEVDRYIADHLEESLADLERLARIPSVSAKGEGIAEAAECVAGLLRDAGFEAQVMPTSGHPVVYADAGASTSSADVGARPASPAGSGRPPDAPTDPSGSPRPAGRGAGGEDPRTLICYNHYDVQPPEPLELWVSPPFEPARRDGRLYARGISDDKGQLVSRIAAMRAVRGVTGGLPARVKFLVEGEEEISSPSLEPFVEQHRDLLAADACVWEFGGVDHEGRPEVVLGLRGICYVEFRVHTLSRDAHSGEAHNLPNAAWRLIWALGSIKGRDERIRIPGFYDTAAPPTESDLRLLDAMPSNEQYTRETYGVREFVGGHRGDAYKRAVYNPTANVAGFGSGWQGKGSKTVTPAEATAKMDFRLVPGQDPQDVLARLRAHLDAQGFGDVEVTYLGGERAGTTPPEEPFVQLTVRTAEEVYDKPAVVKPLIGGSGPMHAFREYLGTPIVTLGCGDPESRAHSPNESIAIEGFARATRHMAHLLLAYGEVGED